MFGSLAGQSVHQFWLPKWMLFISAVSVFNSVQCYMGDLSLSRKVYTGKPQEVTGLSNRTFGTWTLAVAVMRFYAASHLNEPTVFAIVTSTYAIAAFHFLGEWLVFGTAKLGKGLMGPLVVSSVTLTWLYFAKDQFIN